MLRRVFAVGVIGLALLSASPRAPALLREHVPWSQYVQPYGEVEPGLGVPGLRGSGPPAGGAWPGGVVRYHNEAPDQEWALQQAVAAWNRSGAKVRFVPASAGDADVTIVYPRAPQCGHGQATLGYARNARVEIFPRNDGLRACDAYSGAQVLAHELGHVLGLEHDEAGCSLMNPEGSYRGGSLCELTPGWAWHCGLLEPVDVQRAIDLYGGSPVPPRGPRSCELYRPSAPPTILVANVDVPPGWIAVDVLRPVAAALPAFLPTGGTEALGPRLSKGACGGSPAPARRYRWRAAPGAAERLTYEVAAGRAYCLTVWAFDRLGRPSSAPAQLQIDAAGRR